MKFKEFKNENSYGVKTVNSIFYSNVDSLEVSFFYSTLSQGFKPIFNSGFEITSYSYSSNYSYECNGNRGERNISIDEALKLKKWDIMMQKQKC
jgi:hypothetical protein